MRKTVFISSTYVDLKEERRKVWDTLEKFDVAVKGMEQFGARKSDPLTTCLSEVEQSDIYIGIIGMRYGSEEPKTGKSYSQLEYEKAIEKNIEILIYLIDEDSSSVTPKFIQFDKIQKLNNFKEILKEKHTIDSFSNSLDLVSKLQRKFTELLTPKADVVIEDEYENTKKVLDLFLLVPAAYSGREIKLKVKFIGQPQPVSKAIYVNYNFEFGKTIVSKIEVVHPVFEFKNFKHIFIEFRYLQKFLSLDKSTEYEIFANVLFKDEKVKTLTTDFRDRIERVYDESYYADSEPDPGDYYKPEPYYDVLRVGDGQIALSLKDIIIRK
ncbi:hypothetical protein AHMF7605_18335 [Adhaeribacter arboris]|uniref:DUF4062 domain-containing protein n=1 Tax=Adhaeribacter arboris TaxID=2072846 RepID=A0A2T2YIH9_9BACT|nr:DUF4062 domain-containing protein [Adhaeribacter arboris]PSR55324.1 hypothetical protein AHMF7605_18335 [Adhaeribacter arboris]